MFTPNSILYLLQGIRIKDYANQVDFKDVEAQTAYFLSKKHTALTPNVTDGYTYIRKNNSVKVPLPIDVCQKIPYVMYQNTHYQRKWFYAFVREAVYINPETTELVLEQDEWQTWQFDVFFLQSFIERMHTKTDEIGEHYLDEGLGTGEYVTRTTLFQDLSDCWVAIQSTVDLSQGELPPASGTMVAGIYSGVATYIYNPYGTTVQDVLNRVASAGKSDAIVGMYMLPKLACPGHQNGDRLISVPVAVKSFAFGETGEIALGTYDDQYVPKNRKCYVYPYRAFVVGSTTGGSVTFRPELCQDATSISFRMSMGGNSGGSAICYPSYYAGLENAVTYKVETSSYEQCQWIRDNYLNWSAVANIRNRWDVSNENASFVKNLASTGISTLGNYARMNFWGGTVSGLESTAQNTLNFLYNQEMISRGLQEEREVHSIIPPSANGTSGGSALLSADKYGFYFYLRTITAKYAESIDNYFTMYGYKVNVIGYPDYNTRPAFNYIKTVGVNIRSDISNQSLNTIRTMFDSGTTLWHDPDSIGDYGQDNRPEGEAPDPTPDKISVQVVGGEGGGLYVEGAVITLQADNPDDFSEWSMSPDGDDYGWFDYVNVTPTNFHVGKYPVVITAVAKAPEPEPEPDPDNPTIADLMAKDIGAVEWDSTVGKIQRWYYGSYVKAHWCASSLTYYAYEGGWGTKVPKNANVDALWHDMMEIDIPRPGEGYWYTANYGGTNTMPKRGDLIFFSSGHTTSDLTHVGVVSKVSGTSISYISGNTTNPTSGQPDGIFEKTLEITNKYVVCFAIVDY